MTELSNSQLLMLNKTMDYTIIKTSVRRHEIGLQKTSGLISGIKNVFGLFIGITLYPIIYFVKNFFEPLIKDANVANVRSQVMWRILTNFDKLNDIKKKGNMYDVWNEIIIYLKDAIEYEKNSVSYGKNPNKQYLKMLENLVDRFDKSNQPKVSSDVNVKSVDTSAIPVGASESNTVDEDLKNKINNYVNVFNKMQEYDLKDAMWDNYKVIELFESQQYILMGILKPLVDQGNFKALGVGIIPDIIEGINQFVEWFNQNESQLMKKSDLLNLIDIDVVEKELEYYKNLWASAFFGSEHSDVDDMIHQVELEINEAKRNNKTKISKVNFNKLQTYVEQFKSQNSNVNIKSKQQNMPDNVIPVDFGKSTNQEQVLDSDLLSEDGAL